MSVDSSNSLEKNHFRQTLLSSSEGHLLLVGMSLAVSYLIWLGVQLMLRPENFQGYVGMTATEAVFGRVASMAFGYSQGFGHIRVILVCMAVETVLVLLFYPLFVLIWRQLLVIKWLHNMSDRTRRAAEAHKDFVGRYGIIGLFFFVWLPFWMTGPVVGCMIGYLLGLRAWINITTVLLGTYAAIAGWAFFLHRFQANLAAFGSYTGLILMVLLIAVGGICLLKRNMNNSKRHR
ncbi:MAG: small multi-drug export protein [Planctomycetota bacterium]|jgi:uncharacterized membrane protein